MAAGTEHLSYSPILTPLPYSLDLSGNGSDRDRVLSYTQPRLARLCDHLAGKILQGAIPIPQSCKPFRRIRVDIDAYEDTIVGWGLRVASTTHDDQWVMLNLMLSKGEHKRIERLLTELLRGCPAPKGVSYHLRYRASAENLSSHDVVALITAANACPQA